MQNRSRLYFLVTVLMLASMVLGACQAPEPTAVPKAPAATIVSAPINTSVPPTAVPKKGIELSVGLSADPSNMEPAVNGGTAQRTVKLLVYRGLFNYGKGGVLTPELTASHKISDDGLTYTFTLRAATFHNGDPVTADDVKFTFERILDTKTGATFNKQMSIIKAVNAKDAKTVEVVLNQQMAPFLDYLALPESVIVSKKWTTEKGGNLSANPMGAGPFVFKEYSKGQRVVVEKYAKFYKEGLPKADKITFLLFPDANMRVTALRAGDVDLIEYVPWKDVPAIQSDTNLQVLGGTGAFMGLIFNVNFKPFSDPLVRQAIAYAIDRKVVIDTAFSARGEPIYGMNVPPSSIAYDKKFTNYFSYDQKKAKELLAQAGYPNGFKAKLLATSQYDFHQNTAIAVQAELAKIGITVELDLPDWAARLEKNLKGDYDFLVVGTAGDVSDPDFLSDYYESGGIRLNNAPGFANTRMDQLLKDGRATVDPAKRKAIYIELQELALKESPLVYLMWRDQSYGASKKLQNFEPLPGFLSFQSGYMLENSSK